MVTTSQLAVSGGAGATDLAPNPYREGCPSRRVLDRIGDRWTVLVVGSLGENTLRFSEIRRGIEGISQKMLTQTLRGLERDGLVDRTVHAAVPVRVEYALTSAGRSLLEPLQALEDWAIGHFGGITRAQDEYDARVHAEYPPE